METFTYEVNSFTFHEVDKENKAQDVGKDAAKDEIELVKGFVVESSEDYAFMSRRGKPVDSDWTVFCFAHPNTETGLLMRCKGEARLSCCFYSNEGLTVLAKSVTSSKTLDWKNLIYRSTSQSSGNQKLDQTSIPIFLEHCRLSSNKVTVCISSTPLPSAKILFDALKTSPKGPSRSHAETFYNQDGWDLYLKSSVDEEDESNSASKLVRAHRGVLEKYDYFKTMFESGMLESKALEKSPILQSDQEPALPQATKRLRATLESELDDETYNETLVTDNTSLPVIALDLDLETLRSMVKFIYTGSIELYASHVLSPETEKSTTGCEVKAAWAAADRYGIPELKSAATRFIIKNLPVEGRKKRKQSCIAIRKSKEAATSFLQFFHFNFYIKSKEGESFGPSTSQ